MSASSFRGSPHSRADKEGGRGLSAVYRRAILYAIESLHDYQRSNVDLIRRHTKDLLVDNWNEVLFYKTLKHISNKGGDVEKYNYSFAELSPEYKRNRANSLTMMNTAMRDDNEIVDNNNNNNQQQQCMSISMPELPTVTAQQQQLPQHKTMHVFSDSRSLPARRPEHEKYKIMPRKLYDKTIIKNPMDTH